MLKVFYTNVSALPVSVEGLPLSEYRLKQLEKTIVQEKRRQKIGAELLLNHAVKTILPEQEIPLEIYTDSYGKAFIKDLPFFFSLSHSGDYAVCAVSDSPVGIDAEHGVRCRAAVVQRFFTAAENRFIDEASDKDHEFGRIWTAKEAALKYIGQGLNRSPATVEMQSHDSVLIEPEKLVLNIEHVYINGCNISACSALNIKGLSPTEVKLL